MCFFLAKIKHKNKKEIAVFWKYKIVSIDLHFPFKIKDI